MTGACSEPTADMRPCVGCRSCMWAEDVDAFPRWAPRLKNCRAFIAAANAAGAKAEMLVLPEVGIKGNTHMLMQDDNRGGGAGGGGGGGGGRGAAGGGAARGGS